jgi:hypothetical protein
MAILGILFGFLISFVISAIIIYLAAKLLGEKNGFGTAIVAALTGAFLFTLIFYFIEIGWVAALIGSIAWLVALGSIYKIGWLKSFAISVIIWVFVAIIGLMLPIIAGSF